LVFGFLRDAPVEAALGPWLTDVLGRSVSPSALLSEDFWPRYPSLDEQTSATLPDLVFETDDGLTVLIEAKVGRDEAGLLSAARSRSVVTARSGVDTPTTSSGNYASTDCSTTGFVTAGFSSSSTMQRDGTSHPLNADEGLFEATILLSEYTSHGWPDGAGVCVAVWLTPEGSEHAWLQAGAFYVRGGQGLAREYAGAGMAEQPRIEAMTRIDRSMLAPRCGDTPIAADRGTERLGTRFEAT
jgi:hypothetical protein